MANAEKRSVSTDALETLGTIVTENEKRDAIHLAVEPTKAVEKLYPGQDVGVDGSCANPVGIVDPFLKSAVMPGEWFWLVVYPRQINSLRHVWTHPAFADEPRATQNGVSPSERWLREFAATIPVHFEDLMSHAKDWVEHEEYWCEGGRFEGMSIPDEFWPHYENATNTKVPSERRKYGFFTCAC
jgi:hypothetical protein